ncbi:MAG: glycosyltransferase family 9 protein [Ardenticatenaceae bacterium]|nr:glycosyltransferase family 9 protein [Ardenticatenaceae bacterium]
MAARLASIPFRLRGQRPFTPPQKALILKPCCVSQVMLTTPLLAALHKTYPQTRFDWAVSDWARPAIAGNPRLTELISTGSGGLGQARWRDIKILIERLRQEEYDTCFIPSRSSLLSFIAWQAGISQRIGLDVHGRGFAHTLPVKPASDKQHEAKIYLSLAEAIGIDAALINSVGMEYHAPDLERTAVTRRLIDELDWLGDTPLIIIHPGGGTNPVRTNSKKQWPVERFVRLGNHLAKKYRAQILLVGGKKERPLTETINGLMYTPAANWAGRITLGELGALGEIADLYIGNDAGPTHIAAAVGCPTLAIYGPSDPAVSGPYVVQGPVTALWHKTKTTFDWTNGVTVEETIAAAANLLRQHRSILPT